ncbi:hypothetical protein Q5M49_13300 [Acinetobacter nosocomialis]|uniref:hypothetical protein n=1 Tax=Acinetobacter nosocomialis TaxID=106654 RepID=UPI002703002C|nr:hypothetical protein [Acinetobacter nosocomialis]MDO7194652.1 hypothetical protein [Acinetobacter nosocomialis]
MAKQTTPEFLFEPMLLPQQLFEKFVVFNVNAGYRGRGTPHGVNLIKGNKATLMVNNDGEMNKAAQERYKLMLLKYFKEGKSAMEELNHEVKRIYIAVA